MGLNEMPIEALRHLSRDVACLIAAGEVLEKGGFAPHFSVTPGLPAMVVPPLYNALSGVGLVIISPPSTAGDHSEYPAPSAAGHEPPTAAPAVPSPPPEGQLVGAAPDLLPGGGAVGGGESAGEGVAASSPVRPDPVSPIEPPAACRISAVVAIHAKDGAEGGGESAGEGGSTSDPARPEAEPVVASLSRIDAPNVAHVDRPDHTSPIIQHLTTLTHKGGWTHGRYLQLMELIQSGEDAALVADELGIDPGTIRPRKDLLTGLGKTVKGQRMWTTGEVLAALRILCVDHHAFSAAG